MKLIDEKINPTNYYSVGYSEELNKYILLICITDESVGWFNRYYEITKEEYLWYNTNITLLNALANQCYKDKTNSSRFICSDLTKENI